MSKIRFVGLDVHADTIAVAVAESGGEVRSLGVIPNRLESIRKLIGKLGPIGSLKVCYEAGQQAMSCTGSSPSSGLPVKSWRRAWFRPKRETE